MAERGWTLTGMVHTCSYIGSYAVEEPNNFFATGFHGDAVQLSHNQQVTYASRGLGCPPPSFPPPPTPRPPTTRPPTNPAINRPTKHDRQPPGRRPPSPGRGPPCDVPRITRVGSGVDSPSPATLIYIGAGLRTGSGQ